MASRTTRARCRACSCRLGAARSEHRRSRMRKDISTISSPALRSSRWHTSSARSDSCSTCGRATLAGRSSGIFERDHPRIELSILPIFDNAYSGYGFIEVGRQRDPDAFVPYSLNFDVIAHEVGHQIIYSEVGIPDPGRATAEYLGFHESAADLAALLASLHFDSVVDNLLLTTRGNLYTLNALSRMAELSNHQQIRIAANDRRLSEFAARLEEGARAFRAADRRVLRYPCRCLPREPARRRADHAGSGRAFRQASGDTAVRDGHPTPLRPGVRQGSGRLQDGAASHTRHPRHVSRRHCGI